MWYEWDNVELDPDPVVLDDYLSMACWAGGNLTARLQAAFGVPNVADPEGRFAHRVWAVRPTSETRLRMLYSWNGVYVHKECDYETAFLFLMSLPQVYTESY